MNLCTAVSSGEAAKQYRAVSLCEAASLYKAVSSREVAKQYRVVVLCGNRASSVNRSQELK